MRLAALVASVAIASGGCRHYRAARDIGVVMAVAGPSIAGFAGMLCLPYAFPADEEDPNKDTNLATCRNIALVGAALLAVGLPLTIYAQPGVAKQDAEQSAKIAREGERRYALEEQRFRVKREHASAALADATGAARAGNCSVVVVQARYVYNLDPDFYAATFPRDPDIARCLPPPPPTRDPARDREQAFALVKQARIAARAGNCTLVAEIDRSIRQLDPEVHEAWFMADDAIKTCLATPPAPPPASPNPTPSPGT